MKTTQKSFLLLGLCTFFGFLVYVDFMGGVRGEEKDTVKDAVFESYKKSRSSARKQNIEVLKDITDEVETMGRKYDLMVLSYTKEAVALIDSVKQSIVKGEVTTSEIPFKLSNLCKELHKLDTSINIPYRVDDEYLAFWAKADNKVRTEAAINDLFRIETKTVEAMAAKVGGGWCGWDDYTGHMHELKGNYHKLPKGELHRSRKQVLTHQAVNIAEIRFSNSDRGTQVSIFPTKVEGTIKITGNNARIILRYFTEKNMKYADSLWSRNELFGFRVCLPEKALAIAPAAMFPQKAKDIIHTEKTGSWGEKGLKIKEYEISAEEYEKQVKKLEKDVLAQSGLKVNDSSFAEKINLVSADNYFSLLQLPYYTSSYDRWAIHFQNNKWVSKNTLRFNTTSERLRKENGVFEDKLITYDLPLTSTPEGYVLDWPFPTDLYPLELELEVFPAPGQQLVISEQFKGEDLPQGGKCFFWKKFPFKNLHLELKGETTVVLQSETQEKEEPAFSLSARADLPQEKAAPQHTAFLLDASERTKAQRFGEYAALLLQLLEKEEKHIPSFSLFYFQDEAKAYGKALPNTPTERQKLRRFLQNLKPQGEGTLEEALPKFAEFAPEGSRALLLAAGNIHHGDVHEMTDSLGNQGVKIHSNSPMAHAAPLLQKGLRCYTLEDGIAEQHHPLLNYIAHASGGQRLRFHGLKDAENVMKKLLSQPWEIKKIEVEGAKDLLFSKQIRALLPGQHFQLNGKGQWPGEAKIYLRSTDGRQKTLAFEAETLHSPLPPREYARALLEVYATKGNTPETRFHEATLRKKYNIAGRFFRFSNQLEEACASPYALLKDSDPNWQERTLEKEATLQSYTDAFPNYSPRRVLFAALNRYAIAHEKAFSPEEKELFLNLPESAFEKQEIAQWIARFERATPAEGDVEELREALVKP